MPRQTVDQPIATRAARERLGTRAEPYWRGISAGVSLGYRRAPSGGTWLVRTLIEGRYRESALGRADDAIRADGMTYLDYRQAESKARLKAADQHQQAAGIDPGLGAGLTVADALRDYIRHYERRGGKDARGVGIASNAHILPPLGAVRLDRLSQRRLIGWHHDLAGKPARRRQKAGVRAEPDSRMLDPSDAEAVRRRRTSANRVLTLLKAVLNHALAQGWIGSDAAWKRVKPFREVESPRIQYLSDVEIIRLLDACARDLRQIATAAVLTGLRYGEIAALRPADFDPGARTLAVRVSKGGKPRHVHLTDEGCVFFIQAVEGRSSSSRLFTRVDGLPWGKSHQCRPLRAACAAAGIEPAISFHILRHTYASRLARAGVPMLIIASQLGHQDTRMTERHYAHLSPSHIAEVVRASFAPLGVAP